MPVDRPYYMERLFSAKDEPFIKVITGVRRCGKSTLLDMFEGCLLNAGVPEGNIVRLNFDSRKTRRSATDADSLYDLVVGRMGPGRNYILLDEIQNIKDWEDALIFMFTDLDADLYVTGSNAMMRPPDIGTKLVGRYLDIHVLPLTFGEYLDFVPNEGELIDLFEEYIANGGFPAVALTRPELKAAALDGIFNTILELDVDLKNEVRDKALMRDLAEYLIENIGCTVSFDNITDHIERGGRSVSPNTVSNYVLMMEKAFLLYRVGRTDVKGKKRLKTLGKYYVVDTGVRETLIGSWTDDRGKIMENIVHNELRKRGYEVSVGKVGEFEIDFIAAKHRERIYIQVAYSASDPGVLERELRPLKGIKDNYPKLLLTMDRAGPDNYDGVKNRNLMKWLLSEETSG